jgi:transcriptional regulator with XRE-family HTH domain
MTHTQPASLEVPTWSLTLGRRLQLARVKAGMSQEDVQQRANVPVRSLTRWENGRADPGFARVVQLAKLYGVSADWIADRTAIEQCLRPGLVLLDMLALEILQTLVRSGKSLRDVPATLIRRPGINFAVVIPSEPSVVAPAAAERVEAEVRQLWRQLGGGQ